VGRAATEAGPRAAGTPDLTTLEQHSPTDPATGWRYWQLQRVSGELHSVTHRSVAWRPGKVQRAVCMIGGHDAPATGCACGIHAAPDLETLREESLCLRPTEPLVVGEVALWGAVVADEHGLRAQYAAPRRLALVVGPAEPEGAVAGFLAQLRAYGVPVETMAPAEAMGDVAAAILTYQAMSG
jgi:hypothetical protein